MLVLRVQNHSLLIFFCWLLGNCLHIHFSKNKSKTKTRYYIQEYLGYCNTRHILCESTESGNRTTLYSPIYWDNPEEPIEILERAKRGDVIGYKKPANVIYTT